jgi:UDP-N-acetylglucosamine--N-acetylmuramyl-(pentapeptide) pyrophosphoryl-undecaprenol N-acetylglucosamine transferase
LATAARLRRLEPAAPILFATSGNRVGERFLEGSGFPSVPLFPERAEAPGRTDFVAWARAFGRARALLRDFEPDVVAGFGGYLTALMGLATLGPAPFASLRLLARRPGRIPLVLLDQNAVPGRAVRALQRVAARVLVSLPEARAALGQAPHVQVTGNPLPAEFDVANGNADPAQFGLEPGRPTLLVLGGSQGAVGVNRMVLEARAALRARHPRMQILMLTGEIGRAEVESELARSPEPRTVALPFETRMKQAYQLADVVVARAGGTTLAELAVVGRPMVLVPYPHGDRHQFVNARAFERVGAARVVPEGSGAAGRLADEVSRWLADGAARERDAASARSIGRPGAAERCAREILAVGAMAAGRAS